jgi:NADH:ubiquinone oxidoreductase subunit 4 (subunit M)
MVLAGVILKLGGYGLYRLAPLFLFTSLNAPVVVIAGVGGGFLGVLCCRILDIKVLIAYSSVVHIRLVVVCLITLEKVGLRGA